MLNQGCLEVSSGGGPWQPRDHKGEQFHMMHARRSFRTRGVYHTCRITRVLTFAGHTGQVLPDGAVFTNGSERIVGDSGIEATGGQKHMVRGFISILGCKGGIKVTSMRREDNAARVYEA